MIHVSVCAVCELSDTDCGEAVSHSPTPTTSTTSTPVSVSPVPSLSAPTEAAVSVPAPEPGFLPSIQLTMPTPENTPLMPGRTLGSPAVPPKSPTFMAAAAAAASVGVPDDIRALLDSVSLPDADPHASPLFQQQQRRRERQVLQLVASEQDLIAQEVERLTARGVFAEDAQIVVMAQRAINYRRADKRAHPLPRSETAEFLALAASEVKEPQHTDILWVR